MIEIIINADDFGVNDLVNEQIKEFIKLELITSTTILAMGLSFDSAILIAKENPQISYGVHLCIDEFHSLTNSSVLKKHGIIDDSNCFTRDGIYKIKRPSNLLKKALYEELYEQVKKISETGIVISHIDSHHHFHTTSIWMLKIIKNIAEEFHIRKIRKPLSNRLKLRQTKEMSVQKYHDNSNDNNKKKLFYSKISRGRILLERIVKEKLWGIKAGRFFLTTDKFFSYYQLVNYYNYLKPYIIVNTIEVMCHPGHPSFEYETELIRSNKLDSKLNYNKITYKELK